MGILLHRVVWSVLQFAHIVPSLLEVLWKKKEEDTYYLRVRSRAQQEVNREGGGGHTANNMGGRLERQQQYRERESAVSIDSDKSITPRKRKPNDSRRKGPFSKRPPPLSVFSHCRCQLYKVREVNIQNLAYNSRVLWLHKGPVGSIHLVIESAGIAEVVSISIPSPKGC